MINVDLEKANSKYIQRDHLEYPHLTMFQMIEKIAKEYPDDTAVDMYGTEITFSQLVKRCERAARAFVKLGIKNGDAVTLCMPNIPQVLDAFYGLNRIGAVANMVHPLSAREEISYYLTVSNSKAIVVPDLFYTKVVKALKDVDHKVEVIVVRIQDELNPFLKVAFIAKKGKDYLKYPNGVGMLWSKFIKLGSGDVVLPDHVFDMKKTSVILYSGGTSGKPKGICLSDYNMNACAMQGRERIGFTYTRGLKMLSCMPAFHGFGLGMNLHLVLIHGACCVLMPTFDNESYAKMLLKKKPNFIAGVPTIFAALLNIPELEGKDLSFLIGVFCGGDSLSVELKKKVDTFLKEHNSPCQIREGYGLTECVTASCLTPKDTYKEGSIGVPFPDTTYAIVEPDTDEVVPAGEEGEIILTGPTLMLGYLNDPDETAKALRVLPDGRTWLYTGDIGKMDDEGYVYFSHRRKRMIITNGYNVYPSRLEAALSKCPEVSDCCVIGVKDEKRMQRVRAYIVPSAGVNADDECKKSIIRQLKEQVAGYALPREIIFRDELPKTLVGKVAFRILEEEARNECGGE